MPKFNEAAFVVNTVALRQYLDGGGDASKVFRFENRNDCRTKSIARWPIRFCLAEGSSKTEFVDSMYCLTCAPVCVSCTLFQCFLSWSPCGCYDDYSYSYKCDQELDEKATMEQTGFCGTADPTRSELEMQATLGFKWTLLHYAVYWRLPKSVEILANAGANRDAKTTKGLTPLDFLANQAKTENNNVWLDEVTARLLMNPAIPDQAAKFKSLFEEQVRLRELKVEMEQNKETIQKWRDRRAQLGAFFAINQPESGPDFDKFVGNLLSMMAFNDIVRNLQVKYPDRPLPEPILADFDRQIDMGTEPAIVARVLQHQKETELKTQMVQQGLDAFNKNLSEVSGAPGLVEEMVRSALEDAAEEVAEEAAEKAGGWMMSTLFSGDDDE